MAFLRSPTLAMKSIPSLFPSSSSSSSFRLSSLAFPSPNSPRGASRRPSLVRVRSFSIAIAEPGGIKIDSVPIKPIEGQKTGTSGHRKKFKVFMGENYLADWLQALLNSLPPEDYMGGMLVLGGDGRYFNREAAQEPLPTF